jgi:hypothetical protein
MNHIFGFKSFMEYFYTCLGVNNIIDGGKKNIFIISIILAVTVTTINAFVMEWIWPNPIALYFYLGIIVCDFITGVVAGSLIETFKTSKAMRIMAVIPAHLAILTFFYQIAKINPFAGPVHYIASIFYFAISSIYFLSFLKNLVRLNLLKGKVAEFFEKYVDIHKESVTKKIKKTVEENE